MHIRSLTISCAAIGVALLAFSSPIARADDASFANDVRALGVMTSSVNMISTAESACYLLGPRRRDPADVALRMGRYLLVDPDRSRQFLVLAVNAYCPEYAGLVGA